MGLATVALGLMSVVGAGISAYGSIREGQDQAQASRYNADVARQQATMIEQSGALEAEDKRRQALRLTKRQTALYAASGVTLSGSPLAVMIDSAAEGELDARISEYNTKVGASQARSQAGYDEMQAGMYERGGLYKAGTTLLTAGTNIATNYFGYGYKAPSRYGAIRQG